MKKLQQLLDDIKEALSLFAFSIKLFLTVAHIMIASFIASLFHREHESITVDGEFHAITTDNGLCAAAI